jgi:hypothetical protein
VYRYQARGETEPERERGVPEGEPPEAGGGTGGGRDRAAGVEGGAGEGAGEGGHFVEFRGGWVVAIGVSYFCQGTGLSFLHVRAMDGILGECERCMD